MAEANLAYTAGEAAAASSHSSSCQTRGGGWHSRGRGGGGGMTASLLAYAAAAHAADSCHNSVWQQQILPILQGEQQQHLHTVPHARN